MRTFYVILILFILWNCSGCFKSEPPVYKKNIEEKKTEQITVIENKSDKFEIMEKKEKELREPASVTDLEKTIEQFESMEKKEKEIIQNQEKESNEIEEEVLEWKL